MNVAQAAYLVAHEARTGDGRIGFDDLAEMLGITSRSAGQILRNKVDLNNSVNHLTLNEAVKMTDITGDARILEAWARQLGMALVKIPMPEDCVDQEVVELMAKSLGTHGDVGAEIVKTLADGRVEAHEAKKVNDRAFAHIVTVVSLANRIEGMAEK